MRAAVQEAKYTESPTDIYKGNPFIEAMPNILKPEESYDALSYIPPTPTKRQKALPGHLRIHEIQLLRLLVRPLNDYLELEPKFSMLIRFGYLSRMLSPANWELTYALAARKRNKVLIRPRLENTAYGLLLTGISGQGKTTLVNRLLSLYPEAIVHKDLDGPGSRWTQIVWIRVNVPPGGSLVGLCIRILKEFARILDEPELARVRQNPSISELLDRIGSLARNYFLGLIAIDDLQHLRETNIQHKTAALQFLTDLIEVVGVPVLGIGTYAVVPLFKGAFKSARKTAGLGEHKMYRPIGAGDEQWVDLVDFVWQYQWLTTPRRLTQSLRDELYFQSMGIPDVLIKLYLLAQLYAIRYAKSTRDERITVGLIRDIANRDLQILQPALNILRRAQLKELTTNDLLRFDELFPEDEWFDEVLAAAMRSEHGESNSAKAKEEGGRCSTPKGKSDAEPPLELFDIRKFITSPSRAHEELKAAGLVIASHLDIA